MQFLDNDPWPSQEDAGNVARQVSGVGVVLGQTSDISTSNITARGVGQIPLVWLRGRGKEAPTPTHGVLFETDRNDPAWQTEERKQYNVNRTWPGLPRMVKPWAPGFADSQPAIV